MAVLIVRGLLTADPGGGGSILKKMVLEIDYSVTEVDGSVIGNGSIRDVSRSRWVCVGVVS